MAADNKESSFIRQVGVCLSRCRRAFINENGWKLIISVGLIMLLISTVTGEDLFVTDKGAGHHQKRAPDRSAHVLLCGGPYDP